MARKKKAEAAGPGAPLYMATYGDMVTLILCFFVLLFAMSSIDSQKFQKAIISLRGSLGVLRGGLTSEESETEPDVSGGEEISAGASQSIELDTRHVARTVESYLRSQNLESQIEATVTQRGVAVSISEQFLFESGSAVLKPEGQRVLSRITMLLRDEVPAVSVEGHTDSVPLLGGIYRDNWGLSAARAAVVASWMEVGGGMDPRKLQAVGFGPNHPRVPNDTPEHRASNRRVDLVFLSRHPKY